MHLHRYIPDDGGDSDGKYDKAPPDAMIEGCLECGEGPREHEWVIDPARVHLHVGHRIEIATYGPKDAPVNLAIECVTCYEVLGDIDIFDADDMASAEADSRDPTGPRLTSAKGVIHSR